MATTTFGIAKPSAEAARAFTDDHVYPIHLQDLNFRKLIMVCTLRFDHVLDADKLESGLTRLLEIGDWKKLGGRLRFNAKGDLEIHVPQQYTPQRPAVAFTRNDLSSTSISEHALAKQLPVPTEKISVQPNPYNLIDTGVRPDLPKTIDEMINRDLPQISIHVTSFKDATLVGISWPHSVMDSLGFKAFLHSWSLVVQGKESEVPPLLGANKDVMLQMEQKESYQSDEELIISKHRLTGLKLLSFVFRYVWGMLWNPTPEVRSVFLPKTALSRLDEALQTEVSETKGTDESDAKVSYDQETTLLAWFARFAAANTPANKPVTILSFFNARQRLASMLDQSGVYVQNMVGYSFSFLSGQVAKGPLQPLLNEHTSHVKEQGTVQQSLSFYRAYRRETEEGEAFKLFYGPSDAHVVGCNSLIQADLVNTVDFSAAVVASPDSDKARAPAGTMSCFYYHIMNNRLGGGPDCIYLLTKDHAENMWVIAALPPKVWGKIETALKEYA